MPTARRLPPLRALLAFDAVGRLGTVTAAAEELGVTQPALSQHIRTLEEALGVRLFERRGGRLSLTTQGRAYHQAIAKAFDRIAEETAVVSRGEPERVTVASNFGFTHFWLQARLHELEAAFPETRLRVVSADRGDAEEMRSADIAVQFGEFDRLNARERALMPSLVQPVCSPDFAARHGIAGDTDVARLPRLPLLHMDEHDPRWLDWQGWLAAQGLPPPGERPTFIYNNYPLLIGAACAGRGIALGWAGLVDDFLADGRLVACGPVVEQRDCGYVLSWRSVSPRAREICDWILAACADRRPGAPPRG